MCIIFYEESNKISFCDTDRYAGMKISKIFCSWEVCCTLDESLESGVILADQRLSCHAKR